ncbi:preflagellin peptidase FlaK [Halopenitus malekzadehii]|uniref:Preflagellin peptidase FlaK n=1 Tax=Halopenitus malekzadehii TaxID=1267564 RepID=A0A1H6IR88_9EURY|nr:A24 family peptidase [Halopenitus malekzadehii]SEH49494.1 preflagellin peptidase FlaK [Halopenitus malekzadehii]
MYATAPDLLRLAIVPVFAWAALRDIRTRRLPNRLWPPVYLFGAVLLAVDLLIRWPIGGVADRLFLVRVAISLLFIAPLGVAFWYVGGFGGADAKALVALAIVYPTFPTYVLPIAGIPALPAVEPALGVFSLTILTNTVLVGACYPVGLGIYNALRGRRSPVMVLARPVAIHRLLAVHGRLFETRGGYTRNGLDLDALRMYLRWRGTTLTAVREDPDRYRDPESVTETYAPTDGAAHLEPVTDGSEGSATGDAERPAADAEPMDIEPPDDGSADDPWAAARFLESIEGTAYGTDPETLHEGLETVADPDRDRVWVSPGMPFVVPMFLGIVVSLTYGDVLFAVLRAIGLA